VRVGIPNYIIYNPCIVLSFSHDTLMWPIRVVKIEDTATTNNSLLMLLDKASTAKLSLSFLYLISKSNPKSLANHKC
jgi:hypothetical protein